MRILITGGTGFVGRHLVERLRADGHELSVLSRAPLPDASFPRGVRICPGTLTDPACLHAACEGQDAVVHAAARVGANGQWADYRRTNVSGTRHLARALLACGVRRWVHVSSLIVHDAPRKGERVREHSPRVQHLPHWHHYARSKRLAEHIVERAARQGRIATVILRPGLVLGAGDRSTTPWLIERLEAGPMPMVGTGDNAIPFVAVEDVAEAVANALRLPESPLSVFNLASGTPMTQRELLAAHARALGRPLAVLRIPAGVAQLGAGLLDALDRVRGVERSPGYRLAVAIAGADAHIDGAHAARTLGWQARVPFETAVSNAVSWSRGHAALHPQTTSRTGDDPPEVIT